ncbi:hypothetical protein ACULYO_001518 [Campylobacter upsaliensis]
MKEYTTFGELYKMKILKIVLFTIMILPSISLAKCYYVPCNSNVQSGKTQTKASLEKDFNAIKEELRLVKQSYEDYLKTLKEGNKELDLKIALYRQKALHYKEILFLLSKSIHLEDKNINLKALQ